MDCKSCPLQGVMFHLGFISSVRLILQDGHLLCEAVDRYNASLYVEMADELAWTIEKVRLRAAELGQSSSVYDEDYQNVGRCVVQHSIEQVLNLTRV